MSESQISSPFHQVCTNLVGLAMTPRRALLLLLECVSDGLVFPWYVGQNTDDASMGLCELVVCGGNAATLMHIAQKNVIEAQMKMQIVWLEWSTGKFKCRIKSSCWGDNADVREFFNWKKQFGQQFILENNNNNNNKRKCFTQKKEGERNVRREASYVLSPSPSCSPRKLKWPKALRYQVSMWENEFLPELLD